MEFFEAIQAVEDWQEQRETTLKMIARYRLDIEKIDARTDIDAPTKTKWKIAPEFKQKTLMKLLRAGDAVMEYQRQEIEEIKTKIIPMRHNAEYYRKLELLADSRGVNVNYLTLKDFRK